MDKFIEIEFENKTTLIKLSEILMLELVEEDEGSALTLYIVGGESVSVGAEPGNEKMVQGLYNDIKARLQAL
jgi:hypothetical protein